MNELPTLPDPSAAPAAATPVPAPAVSAPPPPPPPAQPGQVELTVTQILQSPLKMAVIVIFLLLAAHAWSTHNKFQRLRMDMAKSLQKGEVVNAETAATVRSVQELAKDLQAKVALLDNRQLEAQSQQLALEQLY